MRLNNIALFISKFSSQYLCKTIFVSLLIWKPILVLLDPQSNSSICLQTNQVFVFQIEHLIQLFHLRSRKIAIDHSAVTIS